MVPLVYLYLYDIRQAADADPCRHMVPQIVLPDARRGLGSDADVQLDLPDLVGRVRDALVGVRQTCNLNRVVYAVDQVISEPDILDDAGEQLCAASVSRPARSTRGRACRCARCAARRQTDTQPYGQLFPEITPPFQRQE